MTKLRSEIFKDTFAAGLDKLAWPFGLWLLVSFSFTLLALFLNLGGHEQLGDVLKNFVSPTNLLLPIASIALCALGFSGKGKFFSRLSLELHNVCQNVLGAAFGASSSLLLLIEVGKLDIASTKTWLVLLLSILGSVFLGAVFSLPETRTNQTRGSNIFYAPIFLGFIMLATWLFFALFYPHKVT